MQDQGASHRSLAAASTGVAAVARSAGHAPAAPAVADSVHPATAATAPPPVPPRGPAVAPDGGLQLPDRVILAPRRRADEDGTGRVRVWCGSWNMATENVFKVTRVWALG